MNCPDCRRAMKQSEQSSDKWECAYCTVDWSIVRAADIDALLKKGRSFQERETFYTAARQADLNSDEGY